MIVDRYGITSGFTTSPVIDGVPVPYGQRSLPYVENPAQYHRYQFTDDLTNIQAYYNAAPPHIQADIAAYINRKNLQLSSLPSAQLGTVAPVPHFPGAVGGGAQLSLPLSIQQLLDLGLLIEI